MTRWTDRTFYAPGHEPHDPVPVPKASRVLTEHKFRVGALCAGYGGLELALASLIPTELAWVSEIDKYASTVLESRWGVPNLGDLTKIENPPKVDIITAGFPCQPVSTAGKRKGIEDARWIIDDVCRVARAAGARWLILENVRGILSASGGEALARVCQAMAEAGFERWEWATVRASDVGACHRRERWFCVATVADADGHGSANGRRASTPDADIQRFEGIGFGGVCGDDDPLSGGDVDGRLGARFGGYAPAVARWERVIGRPAPDPTVAGRLNPAMVEWMMGIPEGWVTNVGLSRTQQLRILGNGVVPQQAAYAIGNLLPYFSATST